MNKTLIDRLLSFILNNYQNPDLRRRDIINFMKVDKDILYYICSLAFDMSIMELVETIRLSKAIKILTLGSDKAWEKVGYRSGNVFYKAFKKRTGMKVSIVIQMVRTNNPTKNEHLRLNLQQNIWKGKYDIFKKICHDLYKETIESSGQIIRTNHPLKLTIFKIFTNIYKIFIKRFAMNVSIRSYILFGMRVLFGGVFIFSGYMKAIDINSFISVIYKIKFIPYNISEILAFLIIGIELILGIFLILGLYLKPSIKFSIILLSFFTIFLGSVLIFDLEVESCKCFGNFSGKNISFIDIIRNLIFLTLPVIILFNLKYSYFLSIDKSFISINYNSPKGNRIEG